MALDTEDHNHKAMRKRSPSQSNDDNKETSLVVNKLTGSPKNAGAATPSKKQGSSSFPLQACLVCIVFVVIIIVVGFFVFAGLSSFELLKLRVSKIGPTTRLSSDSSSSFNNDMMSDSSTPGERATTKTPLLSSVTIVSMNLAGCEPSAEAPDDWDKSYVAKAVREELLRNNNDPDIIALQECPGPQPEGWANDLFQDDGYKVMGVGYAHAGYVLLLVRETLVPRTTTLLSKSSRLPAVMVQIDVGGEGSLVNICSCHLAPFGGGHNQRRKQIQTLLEISAASSGSAPLVIAGDTNMRLEEDDIMKNSYQLRDVWKEAGQDPATQYTWDTEDHRSDGPTTDGTGGYFNRFYGKDTRQYKTRYDRIYISDTAWERRRVDDDLVKKTNPREEDTDKKLQLEISVKSFGLIANRPVNPFTKTHFLSDHFGITCELNLSF